MTRTERNRARRGQITRKRYSEKIFASLMILGGFIAAVMTDDCTALVLITFFVAPLFCTHRKIFVK